MVTIHRVLKGTLPFKSCSVTFPAGVLCALFVSDEASGRDYRYLESALSFKRLPLNAYLDVLQINVKKCFLKAGLSRVFTSTLLNVCLESESFKSEMQHKTPPRNFKVKATDFVFRY